MEKKFGNVANDPPGINTATTKVDDEINMQFLSTQENDTQAEDKLLKDAVASLRKVQCRFCKGEHWTTKCPYKDNLQPIMEQQMDKTNESAAAPPTQSTMPNSAGGNPGETVGKWVSQRVRGGGTGTAYPSDRGGSSRGGSSYAGGRSSGDMRKQDEATVRVTNLPEETQEQDLRDLFTPFGHVSRVFLAKDKTNNTSKGFAFITFNEKKDAQKAIECVSGFGYDHLILKVEWANKPQN